MNLQDATKLVFRGATAGTISLVLFATSARAVEVAQNSNASDVTGSTIDSNNATNPDSTQNPQPANTPATSGDSGNSVTGQPSNPTNTPTTDNSNNSESSPTSNPAEVPATPSTTNIPVVGPIVPRGEVAPGTAVSTPAQPSLPEVAPIGTPVLSPIKPADTAQPPAAVNQPVTANEVKILSPALNSVLDTPAAIVVLQFVGVDKQSNQTLAVELLVNGVAVDSTLVGRSEIDNTTNIVTQTWYGVPLQAGENTITARLKSNNGTGPSTSVRVQVAGAPTELRISSAQSRISADGRSTATINGQLIDQNGNRSNYDALVTLFTSAGEFVGTDENRDQEGFQVKVLGGQFSVQLRSGLDAQTVRIRATTFKLDAFTQLQFEPNLRPSLVTGVIDLRIGARGTDYYRSFRQFLPADQNNGTQVDLRSSVFAIGKVGDWLFTGAYNSDRPLNQTCDGVNGLFRTNQSCDQNYPVYGDSSTVTAVTPSQDSLYLKFERSSGIPNASSDYFMWGDYNTEEFATKTQLFTATTRQLHGFKANYNLGNLQLTALYGNNVQGFQRDTIAPDGTSGYYFLSRRLLVPGSESIYIELEELNRPGTVVQRTQFQRGPDYEIDYDRGAILFRQPLLQTDLGENGEILVRRIVITYQYESPGTNNSIYGGRVRYHFSRDPSQESWLGATYLKEDQGVRSFELYGADALISLGPKAQLLAEYAWSNNTSDLMGLVSGAAYRVEIAGELIPGVVGRAYYRATDTGFANNATTSFVPGQTRYGVQIAGKVSPTTTLRAQYDHEDNYGTAPRPINSLEEFLTPRTDPVPGSAVDNSLTTISLGVQQQLGAAKLELDLIHRDRQDRIPTSPLSSSSDQLRTRFTAPIVDNVTFFAQNELTLSATADTVFSDRTVLGLNWQAYPGINVRLAQQFFSNGPLAGNSITSLDVTGDYKLGPDTTLTGRYSLLGGANGLTTQGAIGLNHRWVIAPGFRLNLAYERVFGDYLSVTGAGTQFIQPFAPGQGASAIGVQASESYSIGFEYIDDPAFQASARYEFRNSVSGSNTVISAAATGKITPALTALVRYQQANASNQALLGLGDTASLKIGLAYRDPTDDSFNALLRYEYRKNPSVIPDTILLGSGTGSEDQTFAAEAIYAPNWQWEFYGKYALRSSSTYLARDLVGTSTISLAQLRATYRFGYNMDLVGEARWITQPSAGYSETGFSLEAGYYLTPNLRASVGYSSGSIASDLSGSRSAAGFYGGLTIKLNELFDGFGIQRPAPAPVSAPVAAKPERIMARTVPEVLRLDVMQSLKFESEAATLNSIGAAVLDEIAVVLQEYPNLTIEIQGYLASLATVGAETDIDTQRVMAARSYLLSKGIRSQQVVIRSLGKRETVTQETVGFVLTGASETFASLADRLRSGGGVSPVLDILQSLVPLPGIPISAQPATVPAEPSQSVDFSLDSTITSQSESVLEQVATLLKQNSNMTVELQGYITTTSSAATELEMERVIAVRNYLLDKEIPSEQITIRSLGERQLQAQNPRVDLIFTSATPEAADTAQANPGIGTEMAGDSTIRRLMSALNVLLGQDATAAQLIRQAMKIEQPEIQGELIDPALLPDQERKLQ